jgi:MFS transporter, PPP family, 3-phenylpropionic acid transporter
MLTPRLGYSLFYVGYFGFIALEAAFFPLHFQSLGFSYFQIAMLSAVASIVGIISPLLVVRATLFKVSPRKLVVQCAVYSILFYLCFFLFHTFLPVLVSWFIFLSFRRAPLVLVESAAINDAVKEGMNYGRNRLWGSVSFIVVTFVVGSLIDIIGVRSILYAGFVLLVVTLASVYFSRKLFANELVGDGLTKSNLGIKNIVSKENSALLSLLISTALLWGSTAALYVYFSLYLKQLGWSGTMISVAWSIGVLSEIVILLYFDSIQSRFSLLSIFRLSILIAAIRWFILSGTELTSVILLSQSLHAFSFATFHLSAMKLVYHVLPPELKNQGQGVLQAFGIAMGLIIGQVIFGLIAQNLSPNQLLNVLFIGSGFGSILAYVVALRIRVDN